jgi:hypothetical protein
MTIKILLTKTGISTGPFDIYYDSINNLIESNISKSLLTDINGYEVTIPDTANNILIQSKSYCNNIITIPIIGIPTTTTSTTTTTTTTPPTTTSTTTTTTTALPSTTTTSTTTTTTTTPPSDCNLNGGTATYIS